VRCSWSKLQTVGRLAVRQEVEGRGGEGKEVFRVEVEEFAETGWELLESGAWVSAGGGIFAMHVYLILRKLTMAGRNRPKKS
jgi:hypothetical protein